MSSFADTVREELQHLIGLKLSRTALAADMRTIQFGNTEARMGGGVVGEYALHVQCPWRLEDNTHLITGNDDLYVPCDLVATQGAASASTPVLVQGGSMEPSADDQLVFRQ